MRLESASCRALNPAVGMAAAVIEAGAAHGIHRGLRSIVD